MALALLTVLISGGLVGCADNEQRTPIPSPVIRPERSTAEQPGPVKKEAVATEDTTFAAERRRMVEVQLRRRNIHDERVLAAMEKVPRHGFVPADQRHAAYGDFPLPIGSGQTISQPYIVALMTQAANVKPGARCLDIGTGSGYQAAILGELAKEVYSIEIIPELGETARSRLAELGYGNVHVRIGDGYRGWPEKQPFDCIIVAAAPDHVPQPLVDQLAIGGRLVIPVGDLFQELMVLERRPDGSISKRRIESVRFVPMTGEAAKKR
jgi:protein-L-isoaspartate(D-aspartate) O-methyltransferase